MIFRRRAAEPSTFQVSVYEPEGAKAAEFSQSVIQSFSWGSPFFCGTYGAMYRRQPAVRAVVDFLARNIAQLNAKVYERVSDTDRIEVNDHPLATLLRNPNPVTTRYAHMFGTVADAAIYNRAYWRKIRAGRQLAVVRISPAQLTVETDQATGRHTYRMAVNGQEIPRNQLVIFPGYSPDTFDEGISPLETLRRVLQDEMASQINRESMLQNAARASGVITRPAAAPAWSDTARTRFRADLDLLLSGPANSGKVALLEEGMTWQTPSFDAHYDEYVSSRRLTYEEVAIVYFGPIGGRAWLESATQTGSEENHRQMYQDVLGPMLEQFSEEIVLQLLPEVQPVGSNTYVEFNLDAKLKGSFEEQAKVATTATGVPSVTVNETRARMNLPRLDDERFDMPVMPLNVMYGGQPAVTIPTADPSTPPAPTALPAAASARDVLVRHFRRQRLSVTSTTKAGRPVDWSRWDRELAIDLQEVTDLDLGVLVELAHGVNETTRLALEAGDVAVFDDARAEAFAALI